MSSASVSIHEAANSAVSRLYYQLMLRAPSGEAIAGREVAVRLEGDGSLSPSFDSKEVKRETDASGTARVTWYRRSIFGRDIKATLTAMVDAEGTITLEQDADGGDAGPRISHIHRRII